MRVAMRLAIVGCVVALSGSASVFAEDEAAPAMDPEQQAKMELMMQYGSPNDSHSRLEPFVGTWNSIVRYWMEPGGESTESTGMSTNTMIFGGRYLQQDFSGEGMEGHPPFVGIGFTGYDNIREEYTSVWLDNMSTGIMTASGQMDEAGKTLNEHSVFSCPLTGESHRKARAVWTLVDADRSTYESYHTGPDGNEYKAMEIEYSRVQ